MTFWDNITYKIRSGSRLYLLIMINVVVYLGIGIPAVLEYLFTGSHASIIEALTDEYLELSSNLHVVLYHFWTPLTYMFMHDGPFHILFNMLWLYWLGQIFEEYLGQKRILGLYIMGGLAGAVFFLAAYNLIPVFKGEIGIPIVGASAGVMAIIVATATLLPNYSIPMFLIGPVKLKWLALFFVVIDFLDIRGVNSGGEIAHLGGALLGFIYIKRLQAGHDWVAGIANIFKRKRTNLKVVSRGPGRKADSPRQEDIDRVLDKISVSGIDSLNKEEKEILSRASKNEG
jgi:membrane associated rhomboid family serine protease